MLRICDVCGQVDEAPRVLLVCGPGEVPPVNEAMILSVLSRTDLDPEVQTAIVSDLNDNTLMIRHHTEAEVAELDHVDYIECTPFVSAQEG